MNDDSRLDCLDAYPHQDGKRKEKEMKDITYKGYLIRSGLINDFFVGKDGKFFYCCKSLEEAKKAVDLLIN